MPFNTYYAVDILKKLNDAPKKIATVCAKDFNIPYEQFGTQLDGMANEKHKFIFPLSAFPYQVGKTFAEMIVNESTSVKLIMTNAGENFLEEQLKKQ
jgi:hypothetical protein